MDQSSYAELSVFNEDIGAVVATGYVQCWAVVEQEDQPVSGITFALADGVDLTISDETLANLGYVRSADIRPVAPFD